MDRERAWREALEQRNAYRERAERAESLLREAATCIEGLAQQQAMPGDSFRLILNRLKQHLGSNGG